MIEKTQSFKTSDGKIHETFEAAQEHELSALLAGLTNPILNPEEAARLSKLILESAEKFIDILTMKPGSKAKARKINGGTKKRTPKTAGTAITTAAPATT